MLPFGYKYKFLCPFCAGQNSSNQLDVKCKYCQMQIPQRYIAYYGKAPCIFLNLIGDTMVGKSIYLQSLILLLRNMSIYWRDNYVCTPLTESSQYFVSEVEEFQQTGRMASPTQMSIQEAYIYLLMGMERWKNKLLVIRDVAGEVFNLDSYGWDLRYTPYFLFSPAILMMISLPDLRRGNRSLDTLFNTYLTTAQFHQNEGIKRQKVIIVLSKADIFYNTIPAELKKYLQDDPFTLNTNSIYKIDSIWMDTYMNYVRQVSEGIKNWLACRSDGRNLINLAKRFNIDLEFSLVSSLGSDPKDGVLPVSPTPRRVLDPFFLYMDSYKRLS